MLVQRPTGQNHCGNPCPLPFTIKVTELVAETTPPCFLVRRNQAAKESDRLSAGGNIVTIDVTVQGSPVVRDGDPMAAFRRVAAGRPEAILLQVDTVGDADVWFGRIRAWRESLESDFAQPAVIVHVTRGQAGTSEGDLSSLMLRGLDSGVDDVVIAARSAEEIEMRVTHALRFRGMTRQLRARNMELARMNDHDDLTGLLNMRAFRPRLGKLLNSSSGIAAKGVAVVMMDVDLFKQVNDRNNHLVGSDVLRSIGDLIRQWNSMIAARYGGDEFVMAFTATSTTEALVTVEQLRKMISQQVFISHGKAVRVTASFGVSWCAPGESVDMTRALSAADAMLYRSKDFGRNLISVMDLRNPVDLDHVGRPDLVDGDAGRDDNRLAGIDQPEVLQKVG